MNLEHQREHTGLGTFLREALPLTCVRGGGSVEFHFLLVHNVSTVRLAIPETDTAQYARQCAVALSQASGSGKTKMLHEIARETKRPVVIACVARIDADDRTLPFAWFNRKLQECKDIAEGIRLALVLIVSFAEYAAAIAQAADVEDDLRSVAIVRGMQIGLADRCVVALCNVFYTAETKKSVAHCDTIADRLNAKSRVVVAFDEVQALLKMKSSTPGGKRDAVYYVAHAAVQLYDSCKWRVVFCGSHLELNSEVLADYSPLRDRVT
eukprot:Opistho-1_new@107040